MTNEMLGLLLIIVPIGVIVYCIVAPAFFLGAAKIVGIKGRSYFGSMKIIVLSMICFILLTFFALSPLALVVLIFLTKSRFKTSFEYAVTVVVVFCAMQLVLYLCFLAIWSLSDYVGLIGPFLNKDAVKSRGTDYVFRFFAFTELTQFV